MRRLFAGVVVAVIVVIGAVLLWPAPDAGLVVYSGLDYGPAVAAAFTKETGIKVDIVRLSTGSLLARIASQGHHPAWDLAWFDGATAAMSLDQAGLLAHHLPAPANLNAVGKTMLSPQGAYIPTGMTLAGVFIYDPARFGDAAHALERPDAARLSGAGRHERSLDLRPHLPHARRHVEQCRRLAAGPALCRGPEGDGLHMFDKNDATLAALQSQAISLAIVQSSAAVYFAAAHPR